MKKFLILILIGFTQSIFSQNNTTPTTDSNSENQVFKTVGIEVMPEFPGGINEFYKFISQNFIVPKEKPAALTGKIYATFVIEKDGLINEVKILKDLGYGTGNEAMRVLKLSPKWIPGKTKNKEVRVLYTIPITI